MQEITISVTKSSGSTDLVPGIADVTNVKTGVTYHSPQFMPVIMCLKAKAKHGMTEGRVQNSSQFRFSLRAKGTLCYTLHRVPDWLCPDGRSRAHRTPAERKGRCFFIVNFTEIDRSSEIQYSWCHVGGR